MNAESHYLGQIPVALLDPYEKQRKDSVQRFFANGGFPTGADEEWRFSDLDVLGSTEYHRYSPLTGLTVPEKHELPAWIAGFSQRVLLSEGGCINLGETRRTDDLQFGALALPGGGDGDAPVLSSLGLPLTETPNGESAAVAAHLRNPLEDLNCALFDCGFRVSVSRGVETEPILLYSFRRDTGDERPTMLHPRSVIELEAGSRATVVEAHDGSSDTGGWTNPTTVCRVGEGAELRYLRLELESGKLIHTARTTFHLERNARVFSTVLSLGGAQVRNDTAAVLTSEGAEADFSGLFLGVDAQKADHHTLAVHIAKHCASRQLYKNVLSDRARAVFDGRVVVEPGAIGTDATQTNRNLLLSEGARVHTKPRLEINADDVRCAHGAAIGRLDPEALFYLRSRGLGRQDSQDMLVEAFAGEVLDRAPVEAARELGAAGLQRLRGSIAA